MADRELDATTRVEEIDRQLSHHQDSIHELLKERRTLLAITDEEERDSAEMLEEDGRDLGLHDAISDVEWEWLLQDSVEVCRADVLAEAESAAKEAANGDGQPAPAQD